jgi:hypothetical protein
MKEDMEGSGGGGEKSGGRRGNMEVEVERMMEAGFEEVQIMIEVAVEVKEV